MTTTMDGGDHEEDEHQEDEDHHEDGDGHEHDEAMGRRAGPG